MNEYLYLCILNAGYAECHAGWNWKNVRSPFARIYYVTEGEASVEFDDHVQPLRRGYLYYIPAFVRHSCVCDSYFAHYYLHVYEEPQMGDSFLEKLEIPGEIEGSEVELSLLRMLCEGNPNIELPDYNPMTYDKQDYLIESLRRSKTIGLARKVEQEGILYILISRFLKDATYRDTPTARFIGETLQYIRHHLKERISEDTLARIACMSRDHFIRMFKQTVGMTPMAYINMKRIRLAELELITTNRTVKEISQSLSFSDSSHFINMFRRALGVSPQRYRKEHQVSAASPRPDSLTPGASPRRGGPRREEIMNFEL